jgi:hypothetical protein
MPPEEDGSEEEEEAEESNIEDGGDQNRMERSAFEFAANYCLGWRHYSFLNAYTGSTGNLEYNWILNRADLYVGTFSPVNWALIVISVHYRLLSVPYL